MPEDIQQIANKNFQLWLSNPRHPSLQFKPILNGLWSVRVGKHYRAVEKFLSGDVFVWIWIGSHQDYDKL
ncbi:MAG TPA: hypothetical protein PK869_07045 [Candidatus Hydrogenedentes bacterium]|nr:hypothetical protein [Candidatus Hydrogenedentota bacterium]